MGVAPYSISRRDSIVGFLRLNAGKARIRLLYVFCMPVWVGGVLHELPGNLDANGPYQCPCTYDLAVDSSRVAH